MTIWISLGLLLSCFAEDEPALAPDRFAAMKVAESVGAVAMDEVALGEDKGRGPAPAPRAEAKEAGNRGGAGEAARSWFPETFLWAPRVITDEEGRASVPVTLPDTLTTWRILGLAASRGGAQAGAVASVSTRLPIYVEPRVPAALRQGDVLRLPILVFNATDAPYAGALSLRAVGLEGAASIPVSVPAGGRRMETVTLRAEAPGSAAVALDLEGADAVRRELEVLPRGRRSARSRAGVLGDAEEVELTSPAGSDYARVRLLIYPGPLGVLRRALAEAPSRLGSAGARVFALALASRGGALLRALGAEPDEEALRSTRILATQGLVREVTGGDLLRQLTLLDGAGRAAGDDPVIERITTWAREEAAAAQLPDGTWPVPGGAGVQRMLALTAWAAEVLGSEPARVIAEGAFERRAAFLLSPETSDGYTAAMVLASGACPAALEAPLREIVAGALEEGEGGLWRLELPPGVVRPDGQPVSAIEGLAVAARTIGEAGRSRDLLASLVARYDPASGFGDPRSGLAALRAFEDLAAPPPGEALQVSLSMDGALIGRRALDPRAEGELTIAAPVSPGAHRFAIAADGTWPGLAWNLELTSWSPWEGGVAPGGLEVAVHRGEPTLARPLPIAIRVSGPRDTRVTITQELPAGVLPDPASLPEGASVDDRGLRAEVLLGPDGTADLRYTALPSFAGALWSGPTTATAGGVTATSPPELWSIR